MNRLKSNESKRFLMGGKCGCEGRMLNVSGGVKQRSQFERLVHRLDIVGDYVLQVVHTGRAEEQGNT